MSDLSLERALEVVRDLEQDLAGKKAEVDAIARRIQQEKNRVRELIKKGETTGDPLKDLVVRRSGTFGPEEEKALARYHQVQDALRGKVGELVLVEGVVKVPFQSEDRFVVVLRCGILNGEELRIRFPHFLERRQRVGFGDALITGVELPIAKYVILETSLESHVAGPICEWKNQEFHVVEEHPSGGETGLVTVGNEAVRKRAGTAGLIFGEVFNNLISALHRME